MRIQRGCIRTLVIKDLSPVTWIYNISFVSDLIKLPLHNLLLEENLNHSYDCKFVNYSKYIDWALPKQLRKLY